LKRKQTGFLKVVRARQEPKFANLTQYAWALALVWTRHLPTDKPSQDTNIESFMELSSINA
jgi:hypothetical protein